MSTPLFSQTFRHNGSAVFDTMPPICRSYPDVNKLRGMETTILGQHRPFMWIKSFVQHSGWQEMVSLCSLKPRLHYMRRDATWSHDWVPMKSTGLFTLYATRRHATSSPNWLLYPNNRAESRSKRDSVGFRHQKNPFPRIVTRLTRRV